MNKHERAEIKKIILAQIDELVDELPSLGEAPGEMLRLRRLETTVKRIDADNFGECFKCERALPFERLKIHPESMLCPACLEESTD